MHKVNFLDEIFSITLPEQSVMVEYVGSSVLFAQPETTKVRATIKLIVFNFNSIFSQSRDIKTVQWGEAEWCLITC